ALGLPVADNKAVTSFIGGMLGQRKGLAATLIVANAASAIAGLIVPRVLGNLINQVTTPGVTDSVMATIGPTCLTLVGVLMLQAGLYFLARALATRIGYDTLAAAREHIIRTVLRLPVSKVESASTGDLVTRVTRDVGNMAASIRWALPVFVISGVQALLTIVAIILNSWMLAVPLILAFIPQFFSVRHYITHAPKGYIAEGRFYSQINSSLTESVEGARTVEALNLQQARVAKTDEDIEMAAQMEIYTAGLRYQLFLGTGLTYQLPLAFALVLGAWGYSNGWVTLGQIAATTLYLQQVISPLEQVVQTLNQMQGGVSSTERLLGIAAVPPDRTPTDEQPVDEHLIGHDLTFAYREGRDVLHDVTLDLKPGERLAMVGPSGSGKSTLGRLLAGINGPRLGAVEVGGVDVMHLPLERLRTEVALVTQEHHVFVGTIRDNILLAMPDVASDLGIVRREPVPDHRHPARNGVESQDLPRSTGEPSEEGVSVAGGVPGGDASRHPTASLLSGGPPKPALLRNAAVTPPSPRLVENLPADDSPADADDLVWDVLRTVQADDWVRRLPDGIDTMVGSGRQFLTPAQAQQIALARLVMADPHTLVLDEATSLIDPLTARHVEGSMSALLEGRTVVAIAHRLHTAHDAQRIAVVIDGRIVELGSHDELMALGGEYAKLWEAWTS
ncbi:MAG: ABC transporter ATP-binding protein/permease, partial [Propionibacteriaceae bacterium]|nr:ABC transporter ATP-binding protein/permease [Propionibacteriaceae bacterium]